MLLMCSVCEKTFANSSSHNRHVREVHETDPKPWSYGEDSRWSNCCLEENCDNTFRNRKELICHLEENHSIQFEKYYSVMASVNEFEHWKNEIEKVNGCYYVLTKKAASTIGEVLYYICNRSKTRTVNCKIFMSDMEETFFNAWLNTMGGNAEHLYCSWHVDRAWQSNMTKINNKKKRAETYKILKTLQQHTSEDIFFTSLQNAIGHLLGDTETRRFGEYFKNTYSHNIRKWAYCFRQNSPINTNMHLESMHKTIKHFYLERKTVKRLDKGLHAVIRYVRDKSVERIIRLTKGEHTKRSRQCTQHHKQAVQESHSYDVINNGSTWRIQKNENKSYIVNYLLNERCCREICVSCNICSHMYSCDCPFYKERKIICKHIHILVLKGNICGQLVCHENVTESMSVSESLAALSRENLNKEKNIEKIKNLLTNLDNCNYEKLDDSVISQIHQNLLVVNNLTTCPSILTKENKFECKKNTNKRIINPQLRFVSTKKQRVSASTSLKRATVSEVKDIQENLRHTPEEPFIVQSTSALNDHQY